MGQVALLKNDSPAYRVGFFRRMFEAMGHSLVAFTEPEDFLSLRQDKDQDLILTYRYAVSPEIIAASPRLRGIISLRTGTEVIAIDAATQNAVAVVDPVTRRNTAALADGVIALTLASTTDLVRKDRSLRENQPLKSSSARPLYGKTVGFVGFGRIGQAVAERLRPFGVRMTAVTRVPRPLPGGVEAVTLDQLLSSSDIVIVVASLNEESHRMLNRERLRSMKPDVVFVNIARGAIVDEIALCDLAMERPAMRLALDVFETEPLPPESGFRNLPNAILTPHAIAASEEITRVRTTAIAKRAKALLDGHWPENIVNPAVEAEWRARWEGRKA